MFAIGRTPNTAGLGLEEVGVELGWNGTWSSTSIRVLGRQHLRRRRRDRPRDLTPVAIREGHAFADTVFGNKPCMSSTR